MPVQIQLLLLLLLIGAPKKAWERIASKWYTMVECAATTLPNLTQTCAFNNLAVCRISDSTTTTSSPPSVLLPLCRLSCCC